MNKNKKNFVLMVMFIFVISALSVSAATSATNYSFSTNVPQNPQFSESTQKTNSLTYASATVTSGSLNSTTTAGFQVVNNSGTVQGYSKIFSGTYGTYTLGYGSGKGNNGTSYRLRCTWMSTGNYSGSCSGGFRP